MKVLSDSSNKLRKNGKELIALFDGECMMCNTFVRHLDNAGKGHCHSLLATTSLERFVSMVNKPLDYATLLRECKETIIVYVPAQEGIVLKRSRAVAELMGATRSKVLVLLSWLILLVPRLIADSIYKVISRHRRKIIVKSCKPGKMRWIQLDE